MLRGMVLFGVIIAAFAPADAGESHLMRMADVSTDRIVFTYESPTKRIQKQVEAAAARMWVQEMYELGEVDPKARMLVNIEEYGRFSAEANGVPSRIVNDEDTVRAMQQANDAAMLEQQQMEQLAAGAEIVEKGSKAANQAGLVNQQNG